MTDAIPLERLTRTYIKMRDQKAILSKELEDKIGHLDSNMKLVKSAILDHMKELGAESMRTEAGTIFRTVKTYYTTSDWESLGKFIVEHEVPELLEKRLHQGNMKTFLGEHPDLLPPGLNANMEYSVTVRSNSKKKE